MFLSPFFFVCFKIVTCAFLFKQTIIQIALLCDLCLLRVFLLSCVLVFTLKYQIYPHLLSIIPCTAYICINKPIYIINPLREMCLWNKRGNEHLIETMFHYQRHFYVESFAFLFCFRVAHWSCIPYFVLVMSENMETVLHSPPLKHFRA